MFTTFIANSNWTEDISSFTAILITCYKERVSTQKHSKGFWVHT